MLDSLSALRAIDANIQIVIADQSKHHSSQIMAQLREHCKNNVTHLRLSKPSICLLYTSPSPRDQRGSRMPSSA